MLTSWAAFASEALERVGGQAYAQRLALGSLRSGYMFGQCGRTGQWQKRFFVLKPTTLLYYFGSNADEEALGCLDVEAFSKVECGVEGDDGSVVLELVRDEGRLRLRCPEAQSASDWHKSFKHETYGELKATSEILRKQRDEFAMEIGRLEEALQASIEDATRHRQATKQATDRFSYVARGVAALHGVDDALDDDLLARVKTRVEETVVGAAVDRRRAEAAAAAASADRAAAHAATNLLEKVRAERDEARRACAELRAHKRALGRALRAARRTRVPPPDRCDEEESRLPEPTRARRRPEPLEDDESWRENFKGDLRRALQAALRETPAADPHLEPSKPRQVDDDDDDPETEFVPAADEDLAAFLAENEDEEEEILRVEYASAKIGVSFALRDSEIVVAGTTPDYDPDLPVPPVGAALVAINRTTLVPGDPEANMHTLKTAHRPLLLDFRLPPRGDDDGLVASGGPTIAALFRDSRAAAALVKPTKSLVGGLLALRASSTS